MEHSWRNRRAFFKAVKELNIRYVILETDSNLNRDLARKESAFALVYENASYSLFRVAADMDSIPLRDLVR